MDSNRKSAVSDFYLPRRAADSSPTTSNFDSQGRQSHSAGYNQTSFLHTGREEPLKGGQDEEAGESWDVFADFNNAGPRYSTAFVPNTSDGYHQIHTPLAKPDHDDTASTIGPVEMVTVPAFGPEWKKSEMREMTKAGKREKKAEGRKQAWKEWIRDQRGIGGKKWLTRRVIVFVLFALCVVAAIIVAIAIPRVPAFSFNNAAPLATASGAFAKSIPVAFFRAPANFSFPAFAELQLNTQSNFLPLTFLHLRAQVYDSNTFMQVASGDLGKYTVPAKAFPKIQLPLNFTYVASNDTDQTWMAWHAACANKVLYPDGKRPVLQFELQLQAIIRGLPGSHALSAQVTDANCPIMLASNAP